MKRLLVATMAIVFLLLASVPAALAADPGTRDRSAVVTAGGTVEIAATDHVGTLVSLDAAAHIAGQVRTVVIGGGTARLDGATVDSLYVLNGNVDLGPGTTITGNVRTIGGSVTQEPGSVVQGTVNNLSADLTAVAFLLIPLMILFFLGMAIAAVFAALLVAGFAARQTRELEALIVAQPGQVLVAGIGGAVLLPLLAVLLIVTVVGAPVGLGILLVLLPFALFLGWIVAAIWLGDWLVERMRGRREPDRPYLAAVVGVIALAVIGVLPFVTAIATVFGFGAVLLAAWRTWRGRPTLPSPAGPSAAVMAPPVGA